MTDRMTTIQIRSEDKAWLRENYPGFQCDWKRVIALISDLDRMIDRKIEKKGICVLGDGVKHK